MIRRNLEFPKIFTITSFVRCGVASISLDRLQNIIISVRMIDFGILCQTKMISSAIKSIFVLKCHPHYVLHVHIYKICLQMHQTMLKIIKAYKSQKHKKHTETRECG